MSPAISEHEWLVTMTLARLVVRRILQSIPLLFGVITVNFLLIHAAPGDPSSMLLSKTATPEFAASVRAKFGLDKPLYMQYLYYMYQVLQGDLGFSLLRSESVSHLILQRLPATLLLILTAMTIATSVGTLLGVIASRKPYSMRDNATTAIATLGVSTPPFWLGELLLIVFAIYAGIFPISGMVSIRAQLTGFQLALDVARHLVLPAATLALFYLAFITRITRASMLEVLGEDYITTARSKGLTDRAVEQRHALRNALLPVVTYVGFTTGVLLGGAVLTETVFSWPGMGRLLFESLGLRDYPVLLGINIFVSAMVIIADLAVDILYGILDPRIRGGR